MDDLKHGTRDKRGNWAPRDPVAGVAPFYALPPKPMELLAWLKGYLFPWNLLFFISALVYWAWVIPPVAVMQTLAWGWVLKLLALNALGIALFYGAFELRLYMQRVQHTRFKYNAKFPADQKSDVFWFNDQQIDGALRTFLHGVPIWTALEVGALWAYANGYAPWLAWADHPVWLALMVFLVPFIQEAHFYCIHRLIHVPFLYKHVHSVHHNSVNPSPWSSLAMHPVEHLLYFGVGLWHLILPSNPFIMLFQMHRAAFGAIPGHVGFDKMELGGDRAIDMHAYAHYLHHKYFEVNYGDGIVPFDALFGTWHDGTKQADEKMKARFRDKKARANARKGGMPAE
ncbi:sterol desaturase family protein [Mameliella alba]|uniref:sterol desaturase family protein n=1 Tax=Mameliella alba TaxID=561184 RepID=UPI001C97FEDD|nr:sterol desaturase family protein [Mameliella alba]MBY6122621.1 sterol desaturase family protein [Mameliella alba]